MRASAHLLTTIFDLHFISAYYISRNEEETKETRLFPHPQEFTISLRRREAKQLFTEAKLSAPAGRRLSWGQKLFFFILFEIRLPG